MYTTYKQTGQNKFDAKKIYTDGYYISSIEEEMMEMREEMVDLPFIESMDMHANNPTELINHLQELSTYAYANRDIILSTINDIENGKIIKFSDDDKLKKEICELFNNLKQYSLLPIPLNNIHIIISNELEVFLKKYLLWIKKEKYFVCSENWLSLIAKRASQIITSSLIIHIEICYGKIYHISKDIDTDSVFFYIVEKYIMHDINNPDVFVNDVELGEICDVYRRKLNMRICAQNKIYEMCALCISSIVAGIIGNDVFPINGADNAKIISTLNRGNDLSTILHKFIQYITTLLSLLTTNLSVKNIPVQIIRMGTSTLFKFISQLKCVIEHFSKAMAASNLNEYLLYTTSKILFDLDDDMPSSPKCVDRFIFQQTLPHYTYSASFMKRELDLFVGVELKKVVNYIMESYNDVVWTSTKDRNELDVIVSEYRKNIDKFNKLLIDILIITRSGQLTPNDENYRRTQLCYANIHKIIFSYVMSGWERSMDDEISHVEDEYILSPGG